MNGREDPGPDGAELTRLETEYQVYRNLVGGEAVPATVEQVGATTGGRVLVALSLPDETSFVVSFDVDLEGLRELSRLHAAVGHRLTPELSCLVGETLSVRAEDERFHRVSFPEADLSEKLVTFTRDIDWRLLERRLSREYVVALRRVERYRADGAVPRCVPVTGVDVDLQAGRLAVGLDLCGESWTEEFDLPSTDQMESSAYERLVEEVGYGSVEQVPEGEMYVARSTDVVAERGRSFGTLSDAFSDWVLFTDADDAVAACFPERPSRESASPREYAAAAARAGVVLLAAMGASLGLVVLSALLVATGVDRAVAALRVFGVLTLLFGTVLGLLIRLDGPTPAERLGRPPRE